MSISNSIKNLLDIQDENIIFENNCVEKGTYKGKPCKYVTGLLTYRPTHCMQCGINNEEFTVYKNGTQTSRITLPIAGIHPTYLLLKKQRFFCKSCRSSFTAQTQLVKKNCFISEQTKSHIAIKTSEAQSMESISRDCIVSPTTVQRVITETATLYKPYYKALPKHLSFDEFKYAKGKMAFEYVDAETGDILDILDRRDSYTIKNHFIAKYHLKDLRNVETITIDMNAGYVNVIKEIFPQAKIIIDRFHLVQLITRSMNKTRVRIMNQFKTYKGEDMKKYRRLKKYWRLLLKNKSNVSRTEYKFYQMFGQRLESDVIKDMLDYDEELRINYDAYQQLLNAIKNKDYSALVHLLETMKHPFISSYMKTSIWTLKKHLPHIENSFIYPYSNGRIEGINNKIKVLNRVAYGYRNFINFKNRILIHFKMKSINNTLHLESVIAA